MVKNEIAKAVANKLEGCTIKDATAVLEAFEEVIVETLKADPTEAVPVGKIGKFRVKDVAAKMFYFLSIINIVLFVQTVKQNVIIILIRLLIWAYILNVHTAIHLVNGA